MSYRKVCSIRGSVTVFSISLILQLCDSTAVNTNGAPQTVSNENVTVTEANDMSTLTKMASTEVPVSEIKIADQKYSQNTSGEYKHEVLFSNGNWRAEHGEYEDRNGVSVFVIRGVFSYYTREGTYNTTLYIVDEFGYHSVEPPPQLTQDGGGLVDYRPDVETVTECSNEPGSYCIDSKLLALLVG